ncbi:SusD/RagB family nutrient-binding outer membrane lipoprotein [Chryseolinea lacunae]|uniref:SusD/RagB family nutrient-binding outer membrane lipoprotein n=1 Tax=Chryseolinea lacunae TaxID=2801331 RepID=A0ABS1KMV3_9BACT|nr:SusD/RagB family nutrient-binding outer membrane lipoprotein [Chryseolinea lacunae]MBL0740660.1 SusD/RagB family nutrient-binding outer membrane lipoprotein [Chryseolinea lacunae]
MRKISYTLTLLALTLGACTDNFKETNRNPYEITDESLKQDFNHVGAFYPSMLDNIFQDQIADNLVHESFVRHLGTPTPFVSGRNNTTYYITWGDSYWNGVYNNIMAPARQVIAIAEADNYDVFVAWAKLIRIIGASRLSAYHGPIIYTNYGSTEQTIKYDTEETLYNTWFTELDEILATFNANKTYPGLTKFDASYGGDVTKWIKVANSWRLILAMRLSKVKPDLAKTQGEKAIAEPGGLIKTDADAWYLSLYGGPFKPARICFGWGDTRMDAAMESVLVGYEDPRIEKFFDPATDESLYPDHPDFPYKGIRSGALLVAKDDRLTYSTIDASMQNYTKRRMLMPADILFTLAEASLRDWAGAGTAKDNYEAGVKASFTEWGAGGVDNYLSNDTGLPVNYNDPKASGDINDFVNRMTVTVKWDEAADKEVKLDKIMTQKWISSVHNTVEIWVDHRRTGYPKLPYNYKNDSDATWGIIAPNDFLRRMPFINSERNNNPAGVADATTKLGGPDEIGTRLWWDTGGPNF